MKKNRPGQIIEIFALVVGIVGLSIGFATFSNVLKIQIRATVKSSSDTLNVDFSSSDTEVLTNEIVPVASPISLVFTNCQIDNTNDPTISN